MKLKDLEQFLSSVKPFANPKIKLEQYATDDHIAARMIFTAATSFDDIEGKRVVDLGCGCGVLSLACIFMGAEHVLAVDIDQDALDQCQSNMELVEMEDSDGLELVRADVLRLPDTLRGSGPFDTAVLNPPFGTKDNAGIDVKFLQTALRLAPVVYSMHKSSTREYLTGKAKDWGATATVLAQMQFLLSRQFRFHKRDRHYIDVDLVRLERKQ